jgi:hypothetical protein
MEARQEAQSPNDLCVSYKPAHGSCHLGPARNPPKYVSDRLGIQHWQLGDAIHEINAAGNLRAADRVIIYDDGMVTDEQGDPLGNIYDEL